jgi:hypothetical protein
MRALTVAAALLLGGCAGMGAQMRMDKLDTMLRAYDRAVRWSEFETAYALATPAGTKAPDFTRFQGIRPTSYDQLGSLQANADSTQIVRMVEIRYIHTATMVERRLADRQVWEYAEKEGRWYLRSEFPGFP